MFTASREYTVKRQRLYQRRQSFAGAYDKSRNNDTANIGKRVHAATRIDLTRRPSDFRWSSRVERDSEEIFNGEAARDRRRH